MFKTIFSRKRETESDMPSNSSRRKFLGVAGAVSGAGLMLASCTKNDSDNDVDLGSGDVGILNYAYALEQLEAAFYTQVIASPYANMSAQERAYLTDIRDHEVAHREFFKAAISAAGATPIPNLDVNFNTINFGDRNSVLNTAIAFEDLGVSAYNGAGRLITNGDYLVIAGKIVSVEARHAALVRDLLNNGSFANTTDGNGMDIAMTPAQVLQVAGFYVKTPITIKNLPTT